MKTLLFRLNLALYLCLLPFTAYAGPEPTPPPAPTPTAGESFIEKVFEARAATLVVSPALLGSKVGVGFAALLPVGDYAFTGMRVDFLDHNFTAPSAIIGSKYTVKNLPVPFMKEITFIGYGGLYYAVGGAGTENHVVAGVTGIGASATLWKINDNFTLSGAIAAEKLTDQTNPIIRPALALSWSY